MTQTKPIILSGDCIVSNIHHSYKTLVDAFQREGSLVIDLAHVEAADVSLMQLIVSASKTAAVSDREFSLKCVPHNLRDLLCSAGISFDQNSGQIIL